MSYFDQPDYGDPILGMYEEWIEDQYYTPTFNEPYDGLLDALEASIENNEIHPSVENPAIPQHDPLWDPLDRLEKETENQVIRPPTEVNLFEGGPPIMEEHRKDKNPLPGDELHFIREGKYPKYNMRGGSSGITNSCNSGKIFCPVYDGYIDPSVCEDCEYFEENEGEYKCKLMEDDNDEE